MDFCGSGEELLRLTLLEQDVNRSVACVLWTPPFHGIHPGESHAQRERERECMRPLISHLRLTSSPGRTRYTHTRRTQDSPINQSDWSDEMIEDATFNYTDYIQPTNHQYCTTGGVHVHTFTLCPSIPSGHSACFQGTIPTRCTGTNARAWSILNTHVVTRRT